MITTWIKTDPEQRLVYPTLHPASHLTNFLLHAETISLDMLRRCGTKEFQFPQFFNFLLNKQLKLEAKALEDIRLQIETDTITSEQGMKMSNLISLTNIPFVFNTFFTSRAQT